MYGGVPAARRRKVGFTTAIYKSSVYLPQNVSAYEALFRTLATPKSAGKKK